MRAPDRNSALQGLRDWLTRANPKCAGIDIDPDADIIESRVLESLQMVELILFLEQTTGRTILVEELDLRMLRTLNRIYENFFETRQ
jgi:acyl carrier protein